VILRALVLRHLRLRSPLALVTLVAVAIGVAIALAIDLANATAVASFAAGADVVAPRVNLQVLGVGRGFDERTLLRVRALPGVMHASPVIEDGISVGTVAGRPDSGEALSVLGVDLLQPLPRTPGSATSNGAAYGAGADADAAYVALAQRGVIVSARVAGRYGLRAGAPLHAVWGARPVTLRVLGVLPKAATQVDSSVVFVDIVTAQELFDRIGLLDRIDCEVDPAALASVQRTIVRVLPPGTRAVRPADRSAEIRRLLRSFQLNLAALSYIALLVGAFLIYNTLAFSVVRRRPEIGMLRALGASRGSILGAFLFEGAVFGTAGSLLGLGLGAILANASVAAVTRTVDTLYVTAHADGVYYDPLSFAKAFALGVAIAIVSALLPAFEAASTVPAETTRLGSSRPRGGAIVLVAGVGVLLLVAAYAASLAPAYDGVPVFGYASGLLTVFGVALCAPALTVGVARVGRVLAAGRSISAELGAANIAASGRRSGVAVASLTVAVGMTVAVAILVGSFRATVIAWADDVLHADLFVRPAGAPSASDNAVLAPSIVARIRHVNGVAAVDTFRGVAIPFRGNVTTLGATDTSTLATHPRLRLLEGPRAEVQAAVLPGSLRALISEPFAVRFGTSVGDRIALPTPSGTTTFTVAGVYNDYTSDAGVVIIDARTFVRLFHDDGVNQAAIFARPGTDLAALRSAVLRAVEPQRIDVQTNRELRAFVIQVFDRTFAITRALYVISIAVAVLGVVTTLFALVLERRTEIGLLRYVGLSASGVRRMVYVEAAYIGLLGGICGVAVGIALALLLIFVINRQAFGWLIELHVPVASLVEAVVLVLVAALIAGAFPARIAAAVRINEALRSE
jgi:putative ABC transport system permease protein